MQRLRGLLAVMGSLGGFPCPGTEAASRESRQIPGLGILRGQLAPNFTPQAPPGPSAEPSHPAPRPQGLPALPASCAARRSHSRACISAARDTASRRSGQRRSGRGSWRRGGGGVEEGAGSREGGPCRGGVCCEEGEVSALILPAFQRFWEATPLSRTKWSRVCDRFLPWEVRTGS